MIPELVDRVRSAVEAPIERRRPEATGRASTAVEIVPDEGDGVRT